MSFEDRLRAALDRAMADVRAVAQAEVDEVRQSAEVSTAAFRDSAARLSDCIHAIGEAPSLGAVLTVVAGCARVEAGRAAYEMGLGEISDTAQATSPLTAFLE